MKHLGMFLCLFLAAGEARGETANDRIRQSLRNNYLNEIELAKKRLEVSNRLLSSSFQARGQGLRPGGERATEFAKQDIANQDQRIKWLNQQIEDLDKGGQINPAPYAQQLDQSCQNLESCLKQLSEISALTDHVSDIFKFVLSRQTTTPSQGQNDTALWKLAEATVAFDDFSFRCRREIASSTYLAEIKPDRMALCFMQKIQGSNFPIRSGQASWSEIADTDSITSPESSISRHSTGKESALAAKILAAPDASVAPWDVFEASYEMNQGNLAQSLRTAYNCLRIHRHNPAFQRKLLDIRGDRFKGGDNSGAWYHIFGTMLSYELYGTMTKILESVYRSTLLPENSRRSSDSLEEAIDHAGIETMQEFYKLSLQKEKIKGHPDGCRFDYVLGKK